ncbi:MAG: T9SS type A sorting domain-containing protein [Flavobacteriaceae bacterium]|nr:MAG: T9SS type A sorting domain-containing protein [Flavobacteriaceae bacterium]
MKTYTLLLLCFIHIAVFSQISNFSEKFELPSEVEETSGLLFLNGKIITHNDSGNEAKLYEIDSLSGALTRTITITNATNVDWEDITQDNTHVYIGDIGNNNGNRTDLTIYKILKTDYLANTDITAETISFSYEDQTDFSSHPNSSNFDAEAISVYQNQLFIFTKNGSDLMTNVYVVPLTPGTHTAVKVSSFNVSGFITGASYSSFDDSFMLTGYDSTLTPFLIYIDQNRPPGNDIFAGGATKFSLTDELGEGNQVEGITHYNEGNYYISRERLTITVNGIEITRTQKLYQFYNLASTVLSVYEESFKPRIILYPSPSKNYISIAHLNANKRISKIELYNANGVKIKQVVNTTRKISTKNLSTGIFFIKVIFADQSVIIKKMIKI